MEKIHVLDQDTINKIAAGEVVERPMAVVKELVENAIDAKANAITVEIKDGGKALIRITDNGTGIAKEEIPLAFTPHATSKIQDAEDLLEVSSLGFRGEALASIAAVSQMEMVSKTRQAFMGNRYVVHGGDKQQFDSVGCPEGTTIVVRNLFYNTPARLKFLKSSPTEAGYIGSTMERLALSHPEIAFRYITQDQTKLSTPGNGNLKDVIYHIYGREIAANLLEIHRKEVFCQIDGFLGKPVISRGNRKHMIYFINGRFIRSQVIHRAVEEAYAPYSMQHRYPFVVLHITIDPALLDVNVHPQKMELRFTKEQEVFRSVYHGISEGLKQREYIPQVSLQKQTVSREPSKRGAEFFETKRMQQEQGLWGKQEPQPVLEEYTKNSFIKKEMPVSVKAEPSQTMLSNNHEETTKSKLPASDAPSLEKETGVLKAETIYAAAIEQKKKETVRESSPDYTTKPVQETLFDEKGMLQGQTQKEIRIIGQLFSTYWILQYGDSMYMVDQHAAHEKVLYERFMKQWEKKEVLTQMMQPPLILSLSIEEDLALQTHGQFLQQLGFEIEPFGGREYAVVGVPAHLPISQTDTLLMEVLGMLGEYHHKATPKQLLEKMASMSCKAAVKGNTELDSQQAKALLKELMTLENPYHCPHGRPTMIQMTKKEIEKKFKRIV